MPVGKIRPLNHIKYGISGNRFKELYYWCLQYNEWKDELRYKTDTVKSIEITDMPMAHNGSDATQELAIRRAQLSENCELIEQTALETYLEMIMGIPCSRNTYYDRRRKFYWLLSQRKI